MVRKERSAESGSAGSSAGRSLRLLAWLAEAGHAQSLADLASALDLPKPTAHRLCAQLMETGFIARDVKDREFVVGPSLRKLALDALNHGTTRGLRHEVLADLVAQVGETCNFTTLDGAQVLYLDRVEPPWPWRLTLDLGAHVPLHCTASGKLFLALMQPARREALLAQLTLQPLTENTLTTTAALRAEWDAIAAGAYALDREEFITGLVAIAVPVRDEHGELRAALAMHAPLTRISLQDAVARLPALQAAALRMGRLL